MPKPDGTQSAPRGVRSSGHTRWWIVWTLFFSTITNYISRQTFSVLAPMLASQYHFSHADLARILGAFQISYAITWLLGGIFLEFRHRRCMKRGLFDTIERQTNKMVQHL
jgi:sugar phosphate permease